MHMVIAEVRAYIEHTSATGYSADEIREALLVAGWNPQDIADTFAALGTSTPTVPAPPPPPPAVANKHEIARIQAELAHEQKRKKFGVAVSPAAGKRARSMTQWLIDKSIVQNEQQANALLIGIMIMCLGLSAWFIFK